MSSDIFPTPAKSLYSQGYTTKTGNHYVEQRFQEIRGGLFLFWNEMDVKNYF